ncbi:tripeptidyl peptidase A [Mycena rebaudengoi]|nr:tripeptidyl peptidase A [Mycena rebaudengoi]
MRVSFWPLALFSPLAALVSASPQRNLTLQVKENVPIPGGWIRIGRPPSHHRIRLRIGIFQQSFQVLENILYEISNPSHPKYGAHLSKEEVEKLVAPHPASLESVDQWLTSYGIPKSNLVRSPAKDWVSVTLPIPLAEKMLNTASITYWTWEHTSGDTLVRTTTYSLPMHLHQHIELVQPTTMFSRRKGPIAEQFHPEDVQVPNLRGSLMPLTKPHHSIVDPSCATGITIKCIMTLYNAIGYKPKATRKNAIGITAFLQQNANIRDLQFFYHQQLPAAVNSTFKFVPVNGGVNNQTLSAAGEEANLDLQFGLGISYPTPGTLWSTAGRPPFSPDDRTLTNTNEPYLDWLDEILGSRHIPQTISTSYADDEQTVPFTFATRVCKRFAELGCRGISVIFASGDGGVGDGNPDPATQKCRTNDGTNITRFLPAFPSSCPYVTSVGGTMNIPEIGASFSGGGFSNYFARPPYQDKAVNKYLSKLPHGTFDGLFNREGRGSPDVSAQARKFRIFWQGMPITIGGTSASTPAFAGLVALLNDARLSRGHAPLGFLNPLIYKKGIHAFNDIEIGNNPGCGTLGFNATKGWDPVTGLGTPDFKKLMKISN